METLIITSLVVLILISALYLGYQWLIRPFIITVDDTVGFSEDMKLRYRKSTFYDHLKVLSIIDDHTILVRRVYNLQIRGFRAWC